MGEGSAQDADPAAGLAADPQPRAARQRFRWAWTLATAIGLFIGLFLTAGVPLGGGTRVGFLVSAQERGVPLGIAVGIAQWLVLRSWVRRPGGGAGTVRRPAVWLAATVAGFGIGWPTGGLLVERPLSELTIGSLLGPAIVREMTFPFGAISAAIAYASYLLNGLWYSAVGGLLEGAPTAVRTGIDRSVFLGTPRVLQQALAGLLVGAVMGMCQWPVLRWWRLPSGVRWIVASAAAMGLARLGMAALSSWVIQPIVVVIHGTGLGPLSGGPSMPAVVELGISVAIAGTGGLVLGGITGGALARRLAPPPATRLSERQQRWQRIRRRALAGAGGLAVLWGGPACALWMIDPMAGDPLLRTTSPSGRRVAEVYFRDETYGGGYGAVIIQVRDKRIPLIPVDAYETRGPRVGPDDPTGGWQPHVWWLDEERLYVAQERGVLHVGTLPNLRQVFGWDRAARVSGEHLQLLPVYPASIGSDTVRRDGLSGEAFRRVVVRQQMARDVAEWYRQRFSEPPWSAVEVREEVSRGAGGAAVLLCVSAHRSEEAGRQVPYFVAVTGAAARQEDVVITLSARAAVSIGCREQLPSPP